MAKDWFVDTSASREAIISAGREVFFAKPPFADRLKIWSKAAQLQSNIRWQPTNVANGDMAAEVVSGGLREAVGNSKNGGGSMLGTTIALAIDDDGTARHVHLQLISYNTFLGLNQQSDLVKSYAKQLAATISSGGSTAQASRR